MVDKTLPHKVKYETTISAQWEPLVLLVRQCVLFISKRDKNVSYKYWINGTNYVPLFFKSMVWYILRFLKIQYFESDFIGNTHKPFTAELKRVANSVKTGKE